jgi:hypothetical protein
LPVSPNKISSYFALIAVASMMHALAADLRAIKMESAHGPSVLLRCWFLF